MIDYEPEFGAKRDDLRLEGEKEIFEKLAAPVIQHSIEATLNPKSYPVIAQILNTFPIQKQLLETNPGVQAYYQETKTFLENTSSTELSESLQNQQKSLLNELELKASMLTHFYLADLSKPTALAHMVSPLSTKTDEAVFKLYTHLPALVFHLKENAVAQLMVAGATRQILFSDKSQTHKYGDDKKTYLDSGKANLVIKALEKELPTDDSKALALFKEIKRAAEILSSQKEKVISISKAALQKNLFQRNDSVWHKTQSDILQTPITFPNGKEPLLKLLHTVYKDPMLQKATVGEIRKSSFAKTLFPHTTAELTALLKPVFDKKFKEATQVGTAGSYAQHHSSEVFETAQGHLKNHLQQFLKKQDAWSPALWLKHYQELVQTLEKATRVATYQKAQAVYKELRPADDFRLFKAKTSLEYTVHKAIDRAELSYRVRMLILENLPELLNTKETNAFLSLYLSKKVPQERSELLKKLVETMQKRLSVVSKEV